MNFDNFKLYTCEEVSDMLKVSIHTVRSWVCNGSVPYHKVRRFIRFTQDDIDKIMTSSPNQWKSN